MKITCGIRSTFLRSWYLKRPSWEGLISSWIFENPANLFRIFTITYLFYFTQVPTCGKQFTDRSTLRRHLLTHSREKPFLCKECDKTFRTKSACRKHYLRHFKVRLSALSTYASFMQAGCARYFVYTTYQWTPFHTPRPL